MLKNKLLIGMICLAVCCFQFSAYANTITECNFNSDTEQMLIEGHLDKKIKNVLVNLYVYSAGDGSIKYMDQAITGNEGDYTFNVDVKNRFAEGGKFVVKTKAQIESISQFVDATGKEYKEFYLESELQTTYQGIVDGKDSPGLSEILVNNFNRITFDDEQLKNALSNGYEQQVADVIKNTSEVITLSNIKDELKKAALIANIDHSTSNQVKSLIFNNDVFLGIDGNVIFESLAVDNTEPETLNTDWVNDFCLRISNSDVYVDSYQKFVELVEDTVVISKAYYVRGKDGINNVLNDYSSKFDFTIFNSQNNDKDKALQSILVEIENKRVKTISDIQRILNTSYEIIEEEPQQNHGSSSNSSGSGGSGGGKVTVPVIIPSNTEAQDINKVEEDIPQFNDIAEYKWAEESIYRLAKRGVLSGYSEGVFAPMDNLTRAQLCKILCATFGMKTTNAKTKFLDVDINSWYSDYVSTLFKNGFINGVSENSFNPDEDIKRQDVCVIIYRMLEKENLLGDSTLPAEFKDEESIDEYAKVAVNALKTIGLISGSDGFFRPKDSMSRAEIAVVINNLYEYRNKDLIG